MNYDPNDTDFDPRLLTAEEGGDCVKCGRKVSPTTACYIESPKVEGVSILAHQGCVNGMDSRELAAMFQAAAFAALTGTKERPR